VDWSEVEQLAARAMDSPCYTCRAPRVSWAMRVMCVVSCMSPAVRDVEGACFACRVSCVSRVMRVCFGSRRVVSCRVALSFCRACRVVSRSLCCLCLSDRIGPENDSCCGSVCVWSTLDRVGTGSGQCINDTATITIRRGFVADFGNRSVT
jgi:hypothetical protein